jgi:hypothetical protein
MPMTRIMERVLVCERRGSADDSRPLYSVQELTFG